MAASATFALKAGVWFRRGRLFIVSPDSRGTACPLSGRNSTYRPVQILEAGSLFAVPLIVLEPVKPVGLYLIASGNVIDGTVLIGVGEIAKITIVERIFHAGRDKLMT